MKFTRYLDDGWSASVGVQPRSETEARSASTSRLQDHGSVPDKVPTTVGNAHYLRLTEESLLLAGTPDCNATCSLAYSALTPTNIKHLWLENPAKKMHGNTCCYSQCRNPTLSWDTGTGHDESSRGRRSINRSLVLINSDEHSHTVLRFSVT